MFLNSRFTREYFLGLMGNFVEPKDVFLAFTVDQGGNAVNACEALGVEVIKCNCPPRVNSVVLWSLGISGSAARCKNKGMGELTKKLAACVEVFSHSAVNNDMLKELQKLEEDLHRIYELIRRNDKTRGDLICILNVVFTLYLFILNYLVLVCVAAVLHEIFLYFYTPF
ncbi:unnamed protein product [Ascophyllum nodosum]